MSAVVRSASVAGWSVGMNSKQSFALAASAVCRWLSFRVALAICLSALLNSSWTSRVDTSDYDCIFCIMVRCWALLRATASKRRLLNQYCCLAVSCGRLLSFTYFLFPSLSFNLGFKSPICLRNRAAVRCCCLYFFVCRMRLYRCLALSLFLSAKRPSCNFFAMLCLFHCLCFSLQCSNAFRLLVLLSLACSCFFSRYCLSVCNLFFWLSLACSWFLSRYCLSVCSLLFWLSFARSVFSCLYVASVTKRLFTLMA